MESYHIFKRAEAYSLDRFVAAQERMYERALAEVRNGKKLTHWIWYIFPQLRGLGSSNNSLYYGIEGEYEARAYLQHPVLGSRLKEITAVLLNLNVTNIKEVFGELDAMKFCSCMTLFREVSEDDLFEKVINRYFHGIVDDKTLKLLGKLNIDV